MHAECRTQWIINEELSQGITVVYTLWDRAAPYPYCCSPFTLISSASAMLIVNGSKVPLCKVKRSKFWHTPMTWPTSLKLNKVSGQLLFSRSSIVKQPWTDGNERYLRWPLGNHAGRIRTKACRRATPRVTPGRYVQCVRNRNAYWSNLSKDISQKT